MTLPLGICSAMCFWRICSAVCYLMCFPFGMVVKNLPASTGDLGLIPGQEDSLEKEMASHLSILAWKIPWTERILAGYHPWGL